MVKIKYILNIFSLILIAVCFQNCGGFESQYVENTSLSQEGSNLSPPTDDQLSFTKKRGTTKVQKSKLRLLSGPEFVNSIEHITNYKIKKELNFTGVSSGFKTGDNLLLETNVLNVFMTEAENAANNYLDNEALNHFTCLKDEFKQSCYDQVIKVFTERSYRRPATAQELAGLNKLYIKINADLNNRKESLKLVLKRVLLSHQFLYKSEIGNLKTSSGTKLDPYEVASFISYSLTGSPPDTQLYNLAKSNQLNSVNIKRHVSRILSTDKSKNWLNQFFRDWLRLNELSNMKENPEAYTKFSNKEMPTLLNQEFDLFINKIVFDGNGTTVDLLTTNKTFANSDTGYLYQNDVSTNKLVEIEQGDNRSGVLTLASFLSSHSSRVDKETDKPVSRGVLIQNQILCEEVGFPTGLNLAATEDNIKAEHPDFDSYTVRRKFELGMNQSATCTHCHSQFMPYGYLSSNFNALGEYKVLQNERPIISKASPTIGGKSYDFNKISELSLKLANSRQYQHCFSEKLGIFLFGNTDETVDGQLSWLVYDHHNSSGGVIKQMIEKTLSDFRIYQRRRN